jgi:hypothetical protein
VTASETAITFSGIRDRKIRDQLTAMLPDPCIPRSLTPDSQIWLPLAAFAAYGAPDSGAHDPEKHAPDVIRGGHRFSDKIMRN